MLIDRKQRYHLEAPQGLLNDPNGLAYYNGEYYIFFQWNRFEKNHSYKEWGAYTTTNFIDWEFKGSALMPDQEYDLNGVYSGNALVIDDKLCLFYTGNRKINGNRAARQCMAVKQEKFNFLKKGCILETPQEFTDHFRDPNVWKSKDNGYFMMIGAQQSNGKGSIALAHSKDGFHWKYQGVLASSQNYEMIECPNYFMLDGRPVLLYNPQERDNKRDACGKSFSVYKIVDFDEESRSLADKDLDEGYHPMEFGFDFYAPQTFETADGRRILYAWMSRMEAEDEEIFSENQDNIHCLTIPRELSIKDGVLCQMPIRELQDLLGDEISPIRQTDNEVRYNLEDRCYFCNISLNSNTDIRIDCFHGECQLIFDKEKKKITFNRKNWVSGEIDTRECPLEILENIEIWTDQSSIEIFINEGKKVFSARLYPYIDNGELMIQGLHKNNHITVKKFRGGNKYE